MKLVCFTLGFLVRFNRVDWKTHFSIPQDLFKSFNTFFRFCWVFLQTFDIFRLPGPNWGFLNDAGMFKLWRGLLVRFNLIDWKTHFSILQGLLECFNIFLDFVGGFFFKLLMFTSCWDKFGDF